MGHHDPVTGDPLTVGEWLSWRLQGVIRRWTFLGLITLVTLIVWATRNPGALMWWNLGASYLALFIESIVGLAMFGQTRRDAVVLREVRALSQQMSAMMTLLVRDVERIETVVETEIETQVEDQGAERGTARSTLRR